MLKIFAALRAAFSYYNWCIWVVFVPFWSAAGENFGILRSQKRISFDFLPIWWQILRMRMYKKIWFIFFYTFSRKNLYKNIFFYTFFVKIKTLEITGIDVFFWECECIKKYDLYFFIIASDKKYHWYGW